MGIVAPDHVCSIGAAIASQIANETGKTPGITVNHLRVTH